MAKPLSILLLILSFIPTMALSQDEIEGPVSAEIVRVIDGDTLLVEATPWPQQRMEVYVRIRGIDAPEMHSRCDAVRRAALDAQHALEEMTADSPEVRLTKISGDKYFGRILADVALADGRDTAENLLSEGYARRYDGGRKPRVDCPQTE